MATRLAAYLGEMAGWTPENPFGLRHGKRPVIFSGKTAGLLRHSLRPERIFFAMKELIQTAVADSILVKQTLLADPVFLEKIARAARIMVATFRSGGKVLFCGNGGSAADAQHLAAELSGRFYTDRPPLYAEALHVNSSYVTAVANDYGYDAVFARMVQAAGRPGDVLFALSTSGNSPNILLAVDAARAAGMQVIGCTGAAGGQLRERCDVLLNVPSSDTPRIQESHILIGHILCEIVEREMFG